MKKNTFFLFIIISVPFFAQIKLTSNLSEYYDGSSWVNSNKTEYTYDGNNNLTEENEFYWVPSDNQWKKSFETIYSYNSNNNAISIVYKDYDTNTNTISQQRRTNYSYNSDRKIIQFIDQNFENSAWVDYYKTDLAYSNNRISSGLSYYWNGTEWLFSEEEGSQIIINYNANGTINNSENNNWDGVSNWVAYYKSVYTYNANNRVTKDVGQTWDGTNWVANYSSEYTYDTNGNVIKDDEFYFTNGVLSGSYTDTFVFDTTKLMSSFTHPFKDKTGLEFFFSGDPIVNKILSKTSDNNRTTYNYGEATANINNFDSINFVLYPNPATSFLIIDDTNFSLKNVEFFNLLGKKVMTSTSNKIDIESLVNGVYLLRVQDNTGNFAAKRILKKNK